MRIPLLCAALASVALTGCTTYDEGYGPRDRYYGDRDWGPDHDWAMDYHEGNYEPYALGPRDLLHPVAIASLLRAVTEGAAW